MRARRLLLATGLVDELPNIAGLAECWGTTVLHCPYCHGWEVRGQRITVIASGPMAEHQALLFGRLSDRVTVVVHGAVLDDAARERLALMGIAVIDGPVEAVLADGSDVRAVVVGGVAHEADAVVVGPRMHARAEIFEMLGGTVSRHPLGTYVDADPTGRTAVDGVWAAGNVRDLSAMVGAASAAGVLAGAALNVDLLDADVAVAQSASVAGLAESRFGGTGTLDGRPDDSSKASRVSAKTTNND
ncbi:FAD-dependent pyridine nucleotide-disulfide oxidoreductase [Gordonia neofelifaecis NRRL B-59395]|uniref:FAD-dependent pyridine nucleotide-disulfide oxidoreductase n=1 Tax=Gordonia neofelifaecis NRRL B-59395 TaxID=644548 RepID=F1YGA8_9ACTN|nr:FAD-dependent pyridine nucleotide-disulfide oxidoreductase [Gordonia neofelifaecis NRRL B-59395]